MSITNPTAKNFQKFYNAILPYLNGSAHSGFTPIGTVISVMGTTAPLNYLACDGTIYNIADYSELAAYFNQQFGSSNFFGGNGTTTFAVPDLRGEFLRGTGTNSHANQGSGANVGVHQDATAIRELVRQQWEIKFKNPDSTDGTESTVYSSDGGSPYDNNYYTIRPTNTSVLYCIASKNIFMDAGSNYSTEEQVVGTWIDGKPIYQKTINFGTLPNATLKSMAHGISNIDNFVNVFGISYMIFGNVKYNFNIPYVNPYVACSADNINVNVETQSDMSASSAYITLQYTKTTDA